jgi:hypothetical protein
MVNCEGPLDVAVSVKIFFIADIDGINMFLKG